MKAKRTVRTTYNKSQLSTRDIKQLLKSRDYEPAKVSYTQLDLPKWMTIGLKHECSDSGSSNWHKEKFAVASR